MEYVGYLPLSDLQLYSSHGRHIWNGIFHRLLNMTREFKEYSPEATRSEIKEALNAMYVKKTQDRLESLYNNGQFDELFEVNKTKVNGETLPSLRDVLDELPRLVDEFALLEPSKFSVIHGDLCFPNILYDPRNEIIKLIDPRGAFGQFTIYGDSRYDIAKLRHSVVGNYEHLINDQFQVEYNPDQATINYEIQTTKEQEMRKTHFDSILRSRTDINLRRIKLIEALLFLSMTPLHSDDFARQQCIIARGLEKIDSFLD
jgi:hypothetical protein